jgi:hypothetical protein
MTQKTRASVGERIALYAYHKHAVCALQNRAKQLQEPYKVHNALTASKLAERQAKLASVVKSLEIVKDRMHGLRNNLLKDKVPEETLDATKPRSRSQELAEKRAKRETDEFIREEETNAERLVKEELAAFGL